MAEHNRDKEPQQIFNKSDQGTRLGEYMGVGIDWGGVSSKPQQTEEAKKYVDYENKDEGKWDKSTAKEIEGTPANGVVSMFNDFHIFNVNGNNVPVRETDLSKQPWTKASSVIDLIDNPQGARVYKAADFIYSARFGMPINRLITLRRFAYPPGNNILANNGTGKQATPDIARMVTYFDENTNPITDMNFSWKLSWKEMNSEIEQGEVIGDESGFSGFLGKLNNYFGTGGIDKLRGENRIGLDSNPYRDQNKIYGPVDSITQTHYRDRGLFTDFEFEITFDYELKSINGVDQKAAFLDLLSNIFACTYNTGRFWGGARYFNGRTFNTPLMNKLRFMNPRNLNDFMSGAQSFLKGIYDKYTGENGAKNAVETLKEVAKNALCYGIGKLLDAVGRPSILVANSLLNGSPTGYWHLMIGNPLNPIISIGNLILEDTSFKFDSNVLGYDDMPTKFSVVCKLKPAMPLDKAGMESIFNAGKGRTYWQPKDAKARIKKAREQGKAFRTYSDSAVDSILDQVFDYYTNGTDDDANDKDGALAQAKSAEASEQNFEGFENVEISQAVRTMMAYWKPTVYAGQLYD